MALNQNYRNLGILNNQGFLQHYLFENPLTATIKFASINRWSIMEPYDHAGLLSMCYISSEARYSYTQVTNAALRKAITAGETLPPKIPCQCQNAKYSDQASARQSVLAYIRSGITNDIFDVLEDYTHENYLIHLDDSKVRENNVTSTLEIIFKYTWTPEQVVNVI